MIRQNDPSRASKWPSFLRPTPRRLQLINMIHQSRRPTICKANRKEEASPSDFDTAIIWHSMFLLCSVNNTHDKNTSVGCNPPLDCTVSGHRQKGQRVDAKWCNPRGDCTLRAERIAVSGKRYGLTISLSYKK
jgi:hypothetical protein